MQNRSISSEICLENNHKIGRFLPISFWRSLPWNFPRNSGEIGRFFREFDPKNLAKFDFFPRDLSEALNLRMTGRGSRLSSRRLKKGGQSTAGTTNQAWWKQQVKASKKKKYIYIWGEVQGKYMSLFCPLVTAYKMNTRFHESRDVIYDLLLNRHMATWSLFKKLGTVEGQWLYMVYTLVSSPYGTMSITINNCSYSALTWGLSNLL